MPEVVSIEVAKRTVGQGLPTSNTQALKCIARSRAHRSPRRQIITLKYHGTIESDGGGERARDGALDGKSVPLSTPPNPEL